jgi:hypothetical protein
MRAALGEDGFKEACAAFIQATPSTFRNVRWYGGAFSEFLRTNSPCATDLGSGKSRCSSGRSHFAFDAADDPPVTFEGLATLPGEAWRA